MGGEGNESWLPDDRDRIGEEGGRWKFGSLHAVGVHLAIK